MLVSEPIRTARREPAAMILITLLIRLWKALSDRNRQASGGGRGTFPAGQ
jgi:hypothetical protein